MKKQIIPIIYLLITIIISQIITPIQPQQSYSQIYLSPFYQESMTNNQNYTHNLSVNPPDGISEVKSAIIKYDIYLTPTVTFYLWINGQTCNNPTYTVHTTYMDSGIGTIAFDCSNIINKTGNYNITLKPTGANTGASNGWLDLTYMNNPQGTINLLGTEYQTGDQATIFLQLKDSQGLSINNGSCYLDIYYPTNYNLTHPEMINNAPMLFKEEGIYYYDLTAPNYSGVYMTTATCNYAYNRIWIYQDTETTYSPNRTTITGTYTTGTISLNAPNDATYELCTHTTNICEANYLFNISQYGTITNITNINLYWSGYTDKTGITITFSYYNGTAFVTLPNTLTMNTLSVENYVTNSIPTTSLINNSITIKVKTTGGAHNLYNNWLSLAILSETGTIQELKGSSEMHITTHIIETKNLAQQIWDYITNWLNITINQIEYKLDLLLNASNITQTPITILATTESCITGSDWIINATVYGNYGQTLTNTTVECNITTNLWNTTTMTYTPEGQYFEYRNTCPEPTTWNYSITCEEI